MKKILYILMMSTLVAAAIMVFYIFYLLFFPQSVSSLLQIKVSPTSVKTGGTIHLEAKYCKKTQGIATIIRTVESAKDHNVIVPYAFMASNAPIGCGLLELDTILPVNLTPGVYKVDLTVQYQSNPVRVVSEEFFSQSFKVVK